MNEGKKEGNLLDKYGFPIWLFPLFFLVVVLFAACTEWDPQFG